VAKSLSILFSLYPEIVGKIESAKIVFAVILINAGGVLTIKEVQMKRRIVPFLFIIILVISCLQACTSVGEYSIEDTTSDQNAQVSASQSGEGDKEDSGNVGEEVVITEDQTGSDTGQTNVQIPDVVGQTGPAGTGTGIGQVQSGGGGTGDGEGPAEQGDDQTGDSDTVLPPEVNPNGENPLPENGISVSIGDGDASLTIINNSILEIYSVNIAPASDSNWGNNMLPSVILNVNSFVTFTGISGGTYNLQVCDSSLASIQTWMSAEINGAVTWTITEPQLGRSGNSYLTVENQADIPIRIINIVPSTNTEWGVNYLNGTLVNPGEIAVITPLPSGNYNLRAVDIDSNVIETATNFPINAGTRWVVGQEEEQELVYVNLTISNHADNPITEVYYSLSSDGTWGPNQLLSGSINQMGSHTFTNIPAGIYDIRVVFTWDNFQDQMLVDMTSTGYDWVVSELNSPELATLTIVNRSNIVIDSLIFAEGYNPSTGNATDVLNGSLITPNDSFNIFDLETGLYYIEARNNSQWVWGGLITIVGDTTWFIPGQYSHEEVPLTIINNSQYTISSVYLFQNNANVGNNLLGNQELQPGESRALLVYPDSGTFNARDNHQMLIDSLMVGVLDRTTYWTITGEILGSPAQLMIENQSNIPISRVYISPTTSSDWGDDMLTNGILTNGEIHVFGSIPPGMYDLKFESFFGINIQTIHDIYINGMTVVTVTGD
jgi:hypothetical protein